MAGMTGHAALYGSQIMVAVEEIAQEAATVPSSFRAVQRATLAAHVLVVLSGEPLPGNQRQLGGALASLDYALADLNALPDTTPALRARVALVQALLEHLRLDLRALWTEKE
jgi:hypothetical protein